MATGAWEDGPGTSRGQRAKLIPALGMGEGGKGQRGAGQRVTLAFGKKKKEGLLPRSLRLPHKL